MKAFYGSRFSPNMTRTPEGYLICHNVPIARTGPQQYLGRELGLNDRYDQIVIVLRPPDEVFAVATIASFEGKPVTDDHPSEDVRPDNYSSYMKGIVTNVRRGSGEESDLLLADLIIYDPILQSEIESGKREVSCGYDCEWVAQEDGTYVQRQILGNHVAVVKYGRAGARVAIKDNKTIERRKEMSKSNIFARMLAAFAKDATPDELMEASRALPVKDEETVPNPDEKKEASETSQILEMLKKVDERLTALEQSDKKVHEEVSESSLDELEKELSKEEPKKKEPMEDAEESKTIPPEKVTDEEKKDVPLTGDRDAVLAVIKAVKPHIAGIKDAAERKKFSDALAQSLRSVSPQAPEQKASYDEILKVQQEVAKARDSKTSDNSDFGKKCAERNPHLKKEAK